MGEVPAAVRTLRSGLWTDEQAVRRRRIEMGRERREGFMGLRVRSKPNAFVYKIVFVFTL